MNKIVVVTKTNQVNGFRLAGVEAIGLDEVEDVQNLIISWINKKEKILLALDDDLFSGLDKKVISKIYSSEDLMLVTIPLGPVSDSERERKRRIYGMIRHATGIQITLKGEENGSKI